MSLISVLLILSTLFCSLVAGFVFAFAVVVMPGIKMLEDKEFLKAFKVMDKVIQDNQVMFVLAWLGSIILLLILTAMSFWQWEGTQRLWIILSCCIYLFGVQLPTFAINVPLNNKLQRFELNSASEQEILELRKAFESRWMPSNSFRTLMATVTTLILMILLLQF
ncbi:MAG: anthrone oxygenase family protein [Verrucomicrobiota bacterium]